MASYGPDRRRTGRLARPSLARVGGTLAGLRQRGAATGRDRLGRLRIYLVLAVQAGLAAALAWLVAVEALGNPEPVFAPIAAVITIGASVGQRLRRTIELMTGVTIGIAVGDLLIAVIGTGPWQIGLIVSLAIVVAILLKGGGLMMTQAGATAALIASLSPYSPDLELPRFTNAAVGALIGAAVVLLLLPLNPLRLVERQTSPVLDLLATQMTATAAALSARDGAQAEEAACRLDPEPILQQLRDAVQAAHEVVTFSPARRRGRPALAQYQHGADHMERAFRDARGLVRRIATLIREGEPIPSGLPAAVERLGEAVRLLHRELLDGRVPEGARARALQAVSEAGRARSEGLGFHGTVAAAQLRTMVHDLLRATGLERGDARALVRRAFTR